MNKPFCLLTKEEIIREIELRNIVIEPLIKENQIKSTHIDLRLDNEFVKFKTFEEPYIDPAKKLKNVEFLEKEYFTESFIIHPGEFVLGQTFEYIAIPNDIIAHLDGKSSFGRRGVVVHATASNIDPGWKGHLVFELANLGDMPVKLYPLTEVARISFTRIKETEGYSGQYSGQIHIQLPKEDKIAIKIKKIQDDLAN